ncbi:MAG: hypothetical protein R3Y38_01065 [Rikenellaceae bacterium]
MAVSANTPAGLSNAISQLNIEISSVEYAKNKITKWNKIIVSYVIPTLDKDLDYGISAGYLTAFKITPIDFFIELGGVMTYSTYAEKYTQDGESKWNEDTQSYDDPELLDCVNRESYFDIKVPVNLAYRINFADNFSIVPYVGVNVKCSLVSTYKVKVGDLF